MKCKWAEKNQLLLEYHDHEWGLPVFDSNQLFKNLSLQIFQSGLQWELILKKRIEMARALGDFNPQFLTGLSNQEIEKLLIDSRIIRNERKFRAVINNAFVVKRLLADGVCFSDYVWHFVDFVVYDMERNEANKMTETNPLAIRIANKMKIDGFEFIGSKNVSFFLQGSGIVNAHWINCSWRNGH
ncbi:DNA-3-methyladenine glycosylase I [Pediococcus claussenii]|uniref:Methyladenine glycosylase family protein n=1 Tax=Pediococcus claussenii (strain ATCC BAA-344 / DSM 14800 / JCM 18046 / KCTC 3811 / LMG 21948 / P06) TaxID=701521 RepID=G8PCJ2_PEDCP|nr:DNA-3-methyladenine glycosylase I [Pediococcus claussenii]AEV94977.1 methyladenine glycosylase family protein [Pediococcus claussenii ATCC BAA-344]ANZ70166.1 hypothetical protein AYR57_07465 [Pediococcus claussenii]ANZ71982.1 hypothetical protein AYR58_07465 [Pediococcus claussenii]KRN19221.1 hypothetical protein IV79_GL001593 [Pediococcus claussenii]